MKIDSLKDLESTLKVCRKLGVSNIIIGDINITLGDIPEKKATDGASESKEAPQYSEEELIDWSSTSNG